MLLHAAFASTPVDRTSLPQGSLDITAKVRTNPLPWAGQFTPQLVEELLSAYAPSQAVVLDPFVGSGTSLGEAARQGLPAYGNEINPAAVVLARLYRLVNLAPEVRTNLLDDLQDQLFDLIGPRYEPLFFAGPPNELNRAELEAGLVRLWHESPPGSIRCLAAALVVLCDFHRENLDADLVYKVWQKLAETVRTLPVSDAPIVVHHSDARELPIAPSTIDLVLTSPPYINVHNYHQKYRRSAEALACDVLATAKSEIGSNRQNRGNRFLTVIQYSLDMALALQQMAFAAKPGARLILVVGRESSVRGTRFFNGELVTEIAVQGVGMKMQMRQERVFQNRYGVDIYEDILHFRATNEIRDEAYILHVARRIARDVLIASRAQTPPQALLGVHDAIERLEDVQPSPKPVTEVLSNPID